MSIERVRNYFKTWDMEDRILEFPVSSATVELAARAVGCEPARIAKTLSFQLPDGPAHGRKAYTSASTASTTAMLPAAAKVILNAASTVRSCGSADMTPSSAA